MKRKMLVCFLLMLLFACTAVAGEFKVEPQELARWHLRGDGGVAVDSLGKQVLLAEWPGSKGLILASPAAYGTDVVLSYRVRPLTPETVLVVLLSYSGKEGDRPGLNLPADYDGSMGALVRDKDSYFIAFHNAAHNKTPFIHKYRQTQSEATPLAFAKTNVMTLQMHHVEIGRRGGRVWLKIDGEMIAEGRDETMLGDGHILFRIRGTKDRIAACLIKDVSIRLFHEE